MNISGVNIVNMRREWNGQNMISPSCSSIEIAGLSLTTNMGKLCWIWVSQEIIFKSINTKCIAIRISFISQSGLFELRRSEQCVPSCVNVTCVTSTRKKHLTRMSVNVALTFTNVMETSWRNVWISQVTYFSLSTLGILSYVYTSRSLLLHRELK